jgi:hypothetical protein
MVREVIETEGPRIPKQFAEEAATGRQRTEASDRRRIDPVMHEGGEARRVGVVDDPESPVPRVDERAGRRDHPFEHRIEVEVLRDGEDGLEEPCELDLQPRDLTPIARTGHSTSGV